ncbi:alpha-L-rhamnosidase C-terminal domain-containing protein [Rubrivirga sp.]|uniref:alpha-L-rhamnosidase-related protein n=1 Tax=Rubrivirga sp. TaxID=1885344 RepID=UPI003B52ADAE
MRPLVLLAALAAVASAQPSPVWDVDADWTAGWVGPTDLSPADTQNVWTAYRAGLDLDRVPEAAVARIAVDSKYWLWVNGRVVVREGGLKRGPMRGATYADAVDLAPFLVAGENAVAVLVWTWGKEGFSHASTDTPGLLFDLALDGAPTALDWRARVHPAYGDTGPPHPNYRLPESNVRYDAGRELRGWTTRGYRDGLWPRAVPLAPAGADPWGPLVTRPVPQWRDFGLRDYADAPATPFVTAGDTVVVSLPYNAQVTPAFEIDAPAGLTIDIRTDNYRGGGPPNLRAEVVTTEGRQRVEVPGWINGHRVRYAFPAGVTVHRLMFRETGYDADFAGAFASSRPALDTLWQKSLRTLYITMRDSYMDCPDRERAQWWGDVVLEMGESFYALDRRADALSRKAVLELAAWQRPDSTLYSPVPSGPIWSAELPTQMLASVGHYGFWTYVEQTGDLDTARRVYPAVRDYLALWELDADGLVVMRPGGWTWGDWGDDKDLPLIFNGWMALALKGQRALALATGHDADVPAIDAALGRLTEAFDARFWTGTAYRSPDHDGATDDRGNALAVVAGLAPEIRWPALRRVLVEERHASPYFEKYVAEALIQMGHTDDALDRLEDRYAEMIASPITTLWEGWELNSATYGGGTYNHAWSGGPLTLLSSRVVGVEPLEVGWATFRVAPRMGSLASARAVVPSIRGEVVAEVRRGPDRFALDVTVPATTRARLEVPVAGRQSVTLGDAVVWTADGSGEAEVVETPGGPVAEVWVGPGRWSVVAE